MIQARNISFAYKNCPPLFENLSLTVSDGGLILVSGPSGCGKTTLLYCLCGIIPRNISGSLSGEILIDGNPVAGISCAGLPRAVAMVFQEPGSKMFLPTIEDELAFAPENLCVPEEDIKQRISYALELTGLTARQYENPAHLSGGQVKLSALASVMAIPPRVLLIDEIIAGLDAPAVDKVLNCIELLRKQGCSVIVSDHNIKAWNELDGVSNLRIGSIN